jgi:hypothetical protein
MKPDFDSISINELRSYFLAHRDDNEAFYKLADRLEADPEQEPLYPFPDNPETIAVMEQAIRERVQELENKFKES